MNARDRSGEGLPGRPSWEPLTLNEVRDLFRDFPAPWWIAGGVALELAAAGYKRVHRDIDVMILRRDQNGVREILCGWELVIPDPPGAGELRAWRPQETIEAPLHNLWCRRGADRPWSLEILLDESDGDDWVSRREPRLRRALGSIGWRTANGLPVLAPEIGLYYKAKNPSPQDERDFNAVRSRLTRDQRRWLDDALALSFPSHPWRVR